MVLIYKRRRDNLNRLTRGCVDGWASHVWYLFFALGYSVHTYPSIPGCARASGVARTRSAWGVLARTQRAQSPYKCMTNFCIFLCISYIETGTAVRVYGYSHLTGTSTVVRQYGQYDEYRIQFDWKLMTGWQSVRQQSDFLMIVQMAQQLRVTPCHSCTRRALLVFQKPILRFRPRPIQRCIAARQRTNS